MDTQAFTHKSHAIPASLARGVASAGCAGVACVVGAVDSAVISRAIASIWCRNDDVCASHDRRSSLKLACASLSRFSACACAT